MRALRSCDFCDAEAVGAFEVVPPELEPTEAEQRRVVLCGDCKAQLETLLEPLLARAGAASTGAGGDTGADSGSETETDSSSGTVVAAADETTQKRRRTTSPNATVSDSDSSATGDTADAAASESDTPASGSDSAITFETDAAAADRSSPDRSEPNPDSAVESSADPADADEPDRTAAQPSGSEPDSTSSDASGGDDATDASRPPRAYGKVIRLLRNREFPVARADAAELAAGAYDLEPDAVDAVIDHAIENDEFVERDGELHRA